ncbi:MAG: hypothetical protein HDR03_14105 [Lachnospiraceae bacterium]|nr:hypothetical protein [Lachnospiraceae bacterium]
MSKLASKLNKRIMATVLSVAMVMSNMTVYASEVTGPQADNTVEEVAVDAEDTSVTLDDAATSDDEFSSDETADENADEVTDESGQTTNTGGDEVAEPEYDEETDDASLENNEEVNDEEGIVAEALNLLVAEDPSYDGYAKDNKVDVWDFGGETLKDAQGDERTDVNNMLTA